MPAHKALLEFIAARGWTRIGESEWAELIAAFPTATAAPLIKAGIVVEQPFRGIGQHTFEELERSLVELAHIYAARPGLRGFIRKQVIAAKDRARWASRNPRAAEDARRRKSEMLNWMLVWLDDPAMFETWVRLRRERMPVDLEAGVLPGEYAEKEHIDGRVDFEPENIGNPRGGKKAPESQTRD